MNIFEHGWPCADLLILCILTAGFVNGQNMLQLAHGWLSLYHFVSKALSNSCWHVMYCDFRLQLQWWFPALVVIFLLASACCFSSVLCWCWVSDITCAVLSSWTVSVYNSDIDT